MTDPSAKPPTADPAPADPVPARPREAVQRWRLTLARDAVGEVQQREQLAAWETALLATGLPLAGLDLANPRPRFAMAAPLAGPIAGEAELLDVWLTERLPRWRIREAFDGVLPPGHRLVDVFDVWLGEPALPGQVAASVYRAELGEAPAVDQLGLAAGAMLQAAALPRSRRKGDTTVAYDLRPFLQSLEVLALPPAGCALRMTLRHDAEKGIGRPEEVIAELGDRLGTPLVAQRLVRERLVLAERPPPSATRPRPAGRSRRPA